MILYWYPDAGEDANESPVWKRLKKDLSKHKELMLIVETFLDTGGETEAWILCSNPIRLDSLVMACTKCVFLSLSEAVL